VTQDGLFRWQEGKEEILNSHNGLPCDTVFALVRDNRGALWFDTQCGLVVIEAPELNRWLQQPDVKLKVRTLDVFDGAQPGLTNFRPEVSKSPDGKIWFANENILQVVDPEHLQGNGVPPPVQVEQIIADRKNYLPRAGLQLPARTRDVEIDYTALSLVVPEKMRFRYKLEGHDSDWQDPLNRRQAFYTDLPPGNYRFHVMASNNDGVWNEAGAEVGLEVLPAFYQTAWFRICCILATAGILALFYVLRLRFFCWGLARSPLTPTSSDGVRSSFLARSKVISPPSSFRLPVAYNAPVERSVILCDSEDSSVDQSWLSSAGCPARPLSQELISQERELIEAALAECKGRVSGASGAAAKLGLPPSTLGSKIRTLKIEKGRFYCN
jgi:hypothetical protein